ncbi:hypothetical protein R3P38DRAFT_3173243 [Favolaschia claudopus]|uniref:Uncharacterized protein n=1 Tax=Favolaschia claudopus TaxID=2862362 RepID=A0AAW0DFH1_9AGAR
MARVSIPVQETTRLFGTVYSPASDANVRHRALTRKAIELHGADYLERVFGRGSITGLRLVMGTGNRQQEFGVLYTEKDERRLVSFRRTRLLSVEQRGQLEAYRNQYDGYYMKHGNGYTERRGGDKQALQSAEQAFHDYISLSTHGPRPQWTLEPLPGFQQVRVANVPTRRIAPLPLRSIPLRAQRTPPPRHSFLPSPLTSPARATPPPPPARSLPVPPASSVAGPSRAQREIIDIPDSDDEDGVVALESRATSRVELKRRYPDDVIDISNDEDEQPRTKKHRFLGFVDLTI